MEPRLFAPTWTPPSTTLAEAGLGGAPAFAPRLPSKLLTAALGALSIGTERLVRGGAALVHNTQYRRLPSRLSPSRRSTTSRTWTASATWRGHRGADVALARAAAARGDVLVTPSRAVAAEVVERLQVDPARVVAAPLGIDHVLRIRPAESEREAVAEEIRHQGPFVLTAARIERRKNHLGLLRALEHLGDAAPRWVVVGPDGEGAADFHRALSGSPIRGRVSVLGRVSDQSLRARLDACAAFALVPHDEGFGLAPLEAAALGRPVVTSAVPVVEEVAAARRPSCPRTLPRRSRADSSRCSASPTASARPEPGGAGGDLGVLRSAARRGVPARPRALAIEGRDLLAGLVDPRAPRLPGATVEAVPDHLTEWPSR